MPHTITLRALDGSNPLAMLAAMGAFRIATIHDDNATMHWVRQSGWKPVITTERSEEQFIADVLRELHRLAGPVARQRRSEELQKERTRLAKETEKLEKEIAKKGKKAPTPERLAELQTNIAELLHKGHAIDQAISHLAADNLGPAIPFIMANDLVAVAPRDFRTPASECLLNGGLPTVPTDADYFAALGCDGILKEKKGIGPAIEPTPFSLSNGGSGKCLLKDFRTCAAHATARSLADILAGKLTREDDVTSLLWDPLDQKSYALRWADPGNSKNKNLCNATTNALAFVGLTAQTAMPVGGRLAAVGMDKRSRQWSWPIWTIPISHSTATALAALRVVNPEEANPNQGRAIGIAVVYSCRRYFLNKRPFFSPAKAV